MLQDIIIKGANENNLKDVDLTLPKNKLIVFTGVSGCGKSSLAFDTIFAEGQRRYMESLSSYARQFLGQMKKPKVDSIDGLSPAISIDQKSTNNNPRSTVGTITEIYDYIRLLFARIGKIYCPKCGKAVTVQTLDQIVDAIKDCEVGSKLMIMSPVVRGQKGTHEKVFDDLRKDGYVRVQVDGEIYLLEDEIKLEKNKRHDINVVVDRIILKDDIDKRLTESVEKCLALSNGLVLVQNGEQVKLYSVRYACVDCGISMPEIEPTLFSFNHRDGACPKCSGLGYVVKIGENAIVRNDRLSINEGALNIMGWNVENSTMSRRAYKKLSMKYNFSLDVPYYTLPKEVRQILIYGEEGADKQGESNIHQFVMRDDLKFTGVVPDLLRKFQDSQSQYIKDEIMKLMSEDTCPECYGKRLNNIALSVKVNNKNIAQVTDMSISDLYKFLDGLKLNATEEKVARPILNEIFARLQFMINVGLKYLNLSRRAGTLSGGESQRIRLATQIGSGLTGVLYILDEPSIGLHQRDNDRLIETLKRLRDLGNTLIVVEHDEDTIRAADYIVDVGVNAGVNGGNVVACGTLEDIMAEPKSITGQYLSGALKIEVPQNRRPAENGFIELKGCKKHNLKDIDVKFPIGIFTCVTGVSGSGKSTLINDILYPALKNELDGEKNETNLKKVVGAEAIDKIINIDQSPIGRTPRSNPATYTGVFTKIRELFASTPDAKERGYDIGKFSFNVAGGRCEACDGDGVKKLRMYFMPDVYVPCEVCEGKRYNRDVLQVKYKGKSIYDVLDMTVEEALQFFENLPNIKSRIQTLYDVGLGYIKLGQSATTLSGGEAQRLKLATELSKRDTGKTMYILDEPTTGLHSYDIQKLINILQRFVNGGNTVVVIEHNLDVIKTADYIIDMGVEGGDEGGQVIATGTPEEIIKSKKSQTATYLKKYLKK
ncbi:MAG: excinuclease ABC subunit UvrA [Clostridia bacterium]|nr:excinuclease ABC subunit UvrA [Clostridia bacterium]